LELEEGVRGPVLRHGDRAEVVVGLLKLRVGAGELSLGVPGGDLLVGSRGGRQVALRDQDRALTQKREPVPLHRFQDDVVLVQRIARALVELVVRGEREPGIDVVGRLLDGRLSGSCLPVDQRRSGTDVLVLVVDGGERGDADCEDQDS